MSVANVYVGSPVERIEDLRLLRGRGTFVDDFHLPGEVYGVVLRSSVAHGRLRGVDASAARALPGVHHVITAADLGTVPKIPVRLFPSPEVKPFEQPVLATDKVRYVGEPLAFVLADSVALGEDVAELIQVDIEPLPAVASRAASRADASLLYEGHGTNCALTYHVTKGDADAAFRDAPYVRRERFDIHRHTGVPMEPRGLVARWHDGHMDVWGATKSPFSARRILAASMGLAEADIDMHELDVGGGFGIRGEFYPEDFLVPYAAKLLGRPVKWTEDRREHLMCANHARDAEIDFEIACERDGRIRGFRGTIHVDVGAYLRTAGNIGPRNAGQFLPGPYRVPHYKVDVALQLSDKTPSATYRGPGRYEADFFRERLFDLVAADLGIDRVAFRRRNLLTETELPYPIPAIVPTANPSELDSGAYEVLLDRALTEARWEEKRSLSGKLIDGRWHGLGVGCFIEGGAAGPSENARIRMETDGSATVSVGSSAIGQGLQTVLTQIAADALELPMEKVRLLHGSTTGVTDGWGSYHSRSVVMGGSAILKATEMLRAQLAAANAPLADLSAEQRTVEAKFPNHKHTYSYGAHVAHVAVDPRTGHIELVDYLAVEDAGRVINPLTLHGQVVGAIVQGLGGTILEELAYDTDGQFLAGSFMDYLMPLASDYPNIRAISMPLRPSPNNPLGAKGAGEGGIVPVGGVIANAVADALQSFGVQPNTLPLSPSRVWAMIRDAKKSA